MSILHEFMMVSIVQLSLERYLACCSPCMFTTGSFGDPLPVVVTTVTIDIILVEFLLTLSIFVLVGH